MDKETVHWRGRLEGCNGYAVEGRSFVRLLRRAGYHVQAVSVPSRPDIGSGAGSNKIQRSGSGLTVVHLPWHDYGWEDLTEKVVWRAMFETASVPPEWLQRLKEVDEVWVPSCFNARTFAAAGVDPQKIVVVPEFMDAGWPQETAATYTGQGRFRFLSVFRWQKRKGWDVLLKAYLEEFSADDDTELVLRVDPFGPLTADVRSDITSAIRDVRPHRPPRITLLPFPLSQLEMQELYASAHAFVLPTRGESWGRPFMEAMASGLVTIGTGWGGHLDFMNASNALLIDYELADVPESAAVEWPFFRGQIWAEPSVASVRNCLRQAYQGGPAIDRFRANAAASMRDHYARGQAGEAIIKAVARLAGR
jgi:glycosyltransferase involved in cell wall biosynthesis